MTADDCTKSLQRRWGYAVFFLSFVLYAYTASPYAFPDDSASLLVQHLRLTPFLPVSHPLWGAVIRLIAHFHPGPLVYSLNLFSSLCGAAAIWYLYQITLRFDFDDHVEQNAPWAHMLCATTIAAGFATSIPLWMASNRAHMASFDMVLLLGSIFMLIRYNETGRLWRLCLFAALYSFSMVEFATMLVLAPPMALLALFMMWRHRHLRGRLVLLMVIMPVAALFWWWMLANQYSRSPVYEWRDFSSVTEVLKLFLREAWQNASAGLLQRGWLLVALVTIVPCVAALMTSRGSLRLGETPGNVLFLVVLLSVGMMVLLNGPLAPWTFFGASPLLVTPYILVTTYFGYALTRIYILIANALARRSHPSARPAAVYALLIIALVGTWSYRNASAVSTRSAADVHHISSSMIQQLSGRSLLITDGMLDVSLIIEAHVTRTPLTIWNARMSNLMAYRKFMASTMELPRLKSLAYAGLDPLVLDWLQTDPRAVTNVAVQSSPDFWLAAGLPVIPYKTIFISATNAPDAHQLQQLLVEHEKFWSDIRPALEHLRRDGPEIQFLGLEIQAHLARIANDLGISLENGGLYEEAMRAYRAALDLWPSNVSAALNLAVLVDGNDSAGESSNLIATVRTAMTQPGRSLSLRMIVGRDGHLRQQSAYELLQGVVPRTAAPSPKSDADINDAYSKYLRGDKTEARSLIERVVATDPASDAAWILLGSIAFDQSDTQTVQRCFVHMQAQGKEWPDLLAIMGHMALQSGDPVRARDFLERALKLRPGNVGLMETLVGMDLAEKNYRRAEDRLAPLFLADPGSFIGNFALGTILYERKENGLAEDAFRRALARKPHPPALNNLAWLLQERGAYDEALALVRKSLAINPDLYASWDTMGVILMHKSQYDEANKALSKARELNPDEIDVGLHLAECALRAGRTNEYGDLIASLATKKKLLTDEQKRALLHLERKEYPTEPHVGR